MDAVITWIEFSRFTCAFVLGYSGLQKLLSGVDFSKSLLNYGLAIRERMAKVIAPLILIGELAIAVLFITQVAGITLPLVLSLLAFLVYTVVLIHALGTDADALCNCFGKSELVTRGTIIRNLGLIAVALSGLVLAEAKQELYEGSRLTVLMGASFAALAAALIVNRSRLRRTGGRWKLHL